MQQLLDIHTVNSNKILSSLVDRGFLEADGVGRETKYQISAMFDIDRLSFIDNIANDVKLKDNEIKILNYVMQNGYITNSICKYELGLEKYKSVRLFNSLIKKKK